MCGTTLTASRKKTGFAKPKGYKAISFSEWDNTKLIQWGNTGVTALPSGITQIFRFAVKEVANNFIETATKDMTTRTYDVVGAGTFGLRYCDRIKNLADAKALLDGNWNVFFESNDEESTIEVAGIVNGAEVLTVVESTDAQGFVFTLATSEPIFKQTLTTPAVADYNDALVATS
jgi:hypothetical protein